jgi:hypothetical protein
MMAVLIVALLALSGCAASSVEETAKPGERALAFDAWSGEKTCEISLTGGDAVAVDARITAGTLRLAILGPDGAEAYSGRLTEDAAFTVTVAGDGPYSVRVAGEGAGGSLRLTHPAR